MIITTYLASNAERVCFLLRSNAVGIVASLTGLLLILLLLLVSCGGLLAQGTGRDQKALDADLEAKRREIKEERARANPNKR